jgi:hypothetical protein
MRTFTTTASAMALVGTMITSLSAASAGTLPVNSANAKPADSGQVIQARFVGHGRAFFPGAVIGGIAAGIAGAAIADGAYGYYGPYPYGYYYPPGYYGPYPYGPYWGGPYGY